MGIFEEQGIKYDYDDILIVPKVSTDIKSRYDDIILKYQLPLFTAPMDTVVNLSNAKEFIDAGINVCLPRTIEGKEFYREFIVLPDVNFHLTSDKNEVVNYNNNMFPSIGLNQPLDKHFIEGTKNVLIDVANGHMMSIIDLCRDIREINPDIKIMVGNIANPETYLWYAQTDLVDYIRVGIGNGGGCLTTKQTGVGYPKASLIRETYKYKQQFIEEVENNKKYVNSILQVKQYTRIPAIVADGGYKDYADIVKALGLGADYVMLGSIFNKCIESCAPNYWRGIKVGPKFAYKHFKKGGTIKKYFRGMSTKEAQAAMGKNHIKTSEGVVRFRKVEYTLNKWVENFEHYLRSAMSYSDAKTLDEFIGKADFCQITKNSYDRFNK